MTWRSIDSNTHNMLTCVCVAEYHSWQRNKSTVPEISSVNVSRTFSYWLSGESCNAAMSSCHPQIYVFKAASGTHDAPLARLMHGSDVLSIPAGLTLRAQAYREQAALLRCSLSLEPTGPFKRDAAFSRAETALFVEPQAFYAMVTLLSRLCNMAALTVLIALLSCGAGDDKLSRSCSSSAISEPFHACNDMYVATSSR